MGQKSRHKKQNKAKSNPASSGASTPVANRGIRLSELGASTSTPVKEGVPVRQANAQLVPYEMVGDLRHDIRRILIVVLVNVVIVTGLVIASHKTNKLNQLGERTAKFLQLQ
jgi:hypothetical protein